MRIQDHMKIGFKGVRYKGSICLTLLQMGPYVLGPWPSQTSIFLAFSICGEEGYKLGIFVEKLATNTFIEELFFNFN